MKIKCCRNIIFWTGCALVCGYADLSKNKRATQSTTALSFTDEFIAAKAVDRNITTCMRANPIGFNSHFKTVWWKVDLGDVYNIYSVNILFKNYVGQEKRQRGRFAGFSLFVSNNGSMDSSSLCYKDGPELPSLNFTATCLTAGRYIIYYNERLDEFTYPEGYELIVYTQLCEVTVQECTRGWYGLNCKKRCSERCINNAVCNHVTGGCDGGCAAGWMGVLCDKECEDGTYGNDCIYNCSGNCLNDSPCNRQTGRCDEGCKPGYTNTLCNEHCPLGYYGNKCEQSCSGHCLNNLVCDHIDGTCSDGCEAGYIDKLCNISCRDGYYGKNCLRICSRNCRTCKHTDGSCNCYAGWRRPNCFSACDKSYGENCQYPCSPFCINQTCDPFNGTCLTRCKDKSYGDKCIAEIREEYVSPVSNSIPEAVGGTLGAFVILIVFAALFLIRRKRLHVSSTTGSLYAEIDIRQSENLTYQQLNASKHGTDNINQQQNRLALESGKTYQQLDFSELELEKTYQQLDLSELEASNTYQQLNESALHSDSNYQQQCVSGLVFDNAHQNLSLQ